MAYACSKPGGLTTDNYNYLKCWFILVHDGKEVYDTVFQWAFKKHPNEIKKALFELSNYSNKKYRSDFDVSQRKKIEDGDIQNFDLNLFYLLLQRICSLPDPSDDSWGRNDETDQLPNILYRIKMKRNVLAHTNTEIPEAEMFRQIDELKSLFMNTLDKAATFYNIPYEELNSAKDKISVHILSVQCSNSLISQQDIKDIAEEKAKLAKSEAQADLTLYYKKFSKVLLAPWTIAETFQNVKDVFTDPVIKQSKGNILAQQLTEEESTIDMQNIITSKLPDNSIPNIILIISPSGMGKTTLVKYIILSWIEKNSNIEGLDSVDLILYLDCRGSRIKSFEDLIVTLMPNTLKLFGTRELKILIATMNVLVVIDNVDEITDEALPTYDELLNMNSETFRIFATSTQNLSRVLSKKYHQRHLNLRLEGISDSNITSCVSKMVSSLHLSNSYHPSSEDVEMFISDYISKSSIFSKDAVRSPEILCHLFFHWLMQSKNKSTYTTKTQLFLASHELLSLKLLEKVGSTFQTKLFEQKLLYDRLNKFFDELFRVAFQTMECNEGEVPSECFNDLVNVCTTLQIPLSVLKEVLYIRETNSELPFKKNVSVIFPSLSIHVFYSAMHIIKTCLKENELHLDAINKTFYENMVRRDLYLMLIKFIIGILTFNSLSNLENNIKLIFSHVVSNYKQCSTSTWLECWEETKSDSGIMLEVKENMGESWSLEDDEITPVLLNMLKNMPPKQLTLTFCKNPKEIRLIKVVLEQCSQIPNISVILQMYHNFWVNKYDVCDVYLTALLSNNRTKHILESFAGKLSTEYILRLPPSLKRLALHIKPEDITILNSSLLKLKNLVLLYINLDISFNFPARRVPKLKIPNSNILLYVDVWNISNKYILWACDALSSFSPAYCRLALRKSSLTFHDCKHFIDGLRNKRIHIDSLIIGSTNKFTCDEEQQLGQYASNFECSEVKVIHI
ncbi:UNVERIFIED_CONTAM: hypothetical protein RMT77_009321 [Armadillidium vulgare]